MHNERKIYKAAAAPLLIPGKDERIAEIWRRTKLPKASPKRSINILPQLVEQREVRRMAGSQLGARQLERVGTTHLARGACGPGWAGEHRKRTR